MFSFLLCAIVSLTSIECAQAQYTPQDCCDIAQELIAKQNEFDELDEQLDELEESRQLGLQVQQEIRLRFPFTEDDEQALNDISAVISNIDEEMNTLQTEQNQIAVLVMMLNQELSLCYPLENNEPLTPMPDPLM